MSEVSSLIHDLSIVKSALYAGGPVEIVGAYVDASMWGGIHLAPGETISIEQMVRFDLRGVKHE